MELVKQSARSFHHSFPFFPPSLTVFFYNRDNVWTANTWKGFRDTQKRENYEEEEVDCGKRSESSEALKEKIEIKKGSRERTSRPSSPGNYIVARQGSRDGLPTVVLLLIRGWKPISTFLFASFLLFVRVSTEDEKWVLINGEEEMDYRIREHRSSYEFVTLALFFPSTRNFEILSFRATLLFFPSMAYAPCCVRAPGGNLGKGNLIYNDACLSRTVRWTHSSTQ